MGGPATPIEHKLLELLRQYHRQQSLSYLIFGPWIKVILFDKIGPGLVPNHTQSPLKFRFINYSWHNGIFNSLRLNDVYMHQLNIPKLVQIMACRLFSAKPLSEPMLRYSQLDPTEHIFQLNFIWNSKVFIMHLKILSAKWQPFRLMLNHFLFLSDMMIIQVDIIGLFTKVNYNFAH